MNKKILLYISIIFISLVLGCQDNVKTTKSLTMEHRFNIDLDYLEKKLPKYHKNLFFKLSKDEYKKNINQIRDMIGNLDYYEYKTELIKLFAKIGDSHTGISFFEKGISILPIFSYVYFDGFLIEHTFSQYKYLLGKKLLAVNQIDINKIYEMMQKYSVIDNNSYYKKQFPNLLLMGPFLKDAGVLKDFNENVELKVQDPQNGVIKKYSIKLGLLELNDISSIYEGIVPIPDHKNYKSGIYWYKQIKNTMYFKYNKCMNDKNKPIDKFLDELYNQIISNYGVDSLIIDLRNNGGGNSSLLDSFINKISKIDKLKNNIVVIIGRETFSSAILNTISLKNKCDAILIGEPTGGKPNHYGEIRFKKLPGTGLKVYYSTKYFRIIDQNKDSIYPDIDVKITINNLFKGEDPFLEKSLEILKN